MSLPGQPPLSTDEEITLRRVAHGQSNIAQLRAPDLLRLRALALIAGSARAPTLTAAGKRRFDTLSKPVAMKALDAVAELMAMVNRLTARKKRR